MPVGHCLAGWPRFWYWAGPHQVLPSALSMQFSYSNARGCIARLQFLASQSNCCCLRICMPRLL